MPSASPTATRYTPCAGDAKNAYLQADDLPTHYACYMRMPPLFGYYLARRYGRDAPYHPSTHLFFVFFVMKPVYGHPAAGRQWADTFHGHVEIILGFKSTDTIIPAFSYARKTPAPPRCSSRSLITSFSPVRTPTLPRSARPSTLASL